MNIEEKWRLSIPKVHLTGRANIFRAVSDLKEESLLADSSLSAALQHLLIHHYNVGFITCISLSAKIFFFISCYFFISLFICPFVFCQFSFVLLYIIHTITRMIHT